MPKATLMRKAALFVAGIAFVSSSLTGCTRPEPTPSPQQICQPDALAQERSSAIATVRGAETEGRQSSQTFLRDRLERYEARLEIAYRSMVSSCQLYANCLDRQAGNEGSCMRSEANYAGAREQFYGMISEGDGLAAEVRRAQAQAQVQVQLKRAAPKPEKKKRNNERTHEGRCRPECSTTANVFTDDCCPVKDED